MRHEAQVLTAKSQCLKSSLMRNPITLSMLLNCVNFGYITLNLEQKLWNKCGDATVIYDARLQLIILRAVKQY